MSYAISIVCMYVNQSITVLLHVMQRTVFLSVCLSVCLSVKRVHCDKTKETCATFLYRMKGHSS